MKIRNIVVVRRSSVEALASYLMDFYLQGTLKGGALAIADLSCQNGKM